MSRFITLPICRLLGCNQQLPGIVDSRLIVETSLTEANLYWQSVCVARLDLS